MDYPTGTDVTRTYLANDAPATLTDHTGTYNWSYDARGLVTQAQAPQGTLDLLYDATRQRTNVTRPGIGGTSYGRDDAGRVVSVTNRFTEVTSLTLDAGGRLTEQVNANGTKVLRGYDAARGWVSWMEHRRSDNSLLSRYDHTRDAVGNITRLTATNDYQVDFTFDNTYQLTREVRTGNIPYSHRQEGPGREHRSGISYAYDAVGNRTSKSVLGGATTNYTYGDNNQCLSAGSTTFGYDNNGNLTSKTAGGQTTTYAWGFENELLSIAYPGGATNSFTTHRLGNRVSKADSGGTSDSLYDGAQVLADSRADYTWGGATGLISERAGSASRWYHGDETGGTRGLTDGAQTATDSLDYDSWGLAVRTTGTSLTPFRHKGGLGYRTDPDSGLLLLGARYYDPTLGRFISRDPMGYAAGDPNLYRYAANNPVNASDPSGKWLDTLLDVVGLVLDIKEFVEEPTWSGAVNILVGAATMFLPGVVNPRTMVRIAGWGGWLKKLKDSRFACPLSFARGTPVWMADGTKKPIEQVRKGDYVRSADEWTGKEREGRVSCTFQREADTLLTIRTADGKKIETTPTHPFFVEGRGFVAAKRLARSDLLTDREGWAAAVVSVTERKGRFPVYNLEVAGTGTYYAGEAGWWVHNACAPKWPKTPEEMDDFPGFQGNRVPDGPNTPGRDKVEWRPKEDTKITYEQHPYHPDTPDWHCVA